MSTEQPLIAARGLSKKFSKDIFYNMYYGLLDMFGFGSRSSNAGMKGSVELRKQEFWALRNIELDLMPGEILGVVGMNGSGKTTLMRLLSNIYPADEGVVLGRKNLKVTAVFALSAGMQPLFSGRENIYIKGAMFGMSQAEIDEKMAFIEAFSELGEKLERPYGNYSSGMKARLSYAIAMATEPDVFIIDEALAVGDAAFKDKCFASLKEYVQRPEKAVIFVSNHVNKVLRVATRVMVLEEGKVIHNSTDVPAALDFYISNSGQYLDEKKRRNKLRKIRNFKHDH